jgi:GNAT superfamily N-acetyltransferase
MVSRTHPHEAGTQALGAGVRPMDPARDLAAIARVIEVAFSEELSPGGHLVMRDLYLLNTLSPILWVISRAMPSLYDYLGGFVWEEESRVVGNVTLTRADASGIQWIISNVAVLPAFRRKGIGRALVEASIAHARSRGGGRVLLQVRTDNDGAKRLYEELGFTYLESVTEMISERIPGTQFPYPPDVEIIAPVPNRWHEAYDVARGAVPLAVQRMRPLRTQAFRVPQRSIGEMVRDFFLGAPRERWWAQMNGRVGGLLTIDRQPLRQSEQFEIMVHPQAAGYVETALINKVTERLRGHRGVRVTLAADLTSARQLLRSIGFRESRTLDHMMLEL